MVARLVRTGGTVLAVALGLVTPALATAAPAPASADTVVDGCTIVSNPTPFHSTDCPDADLSGADLDGVDLAYADLAGATFVSCYVEGMANHCSATNLTDADLTDADLVGTDFFTVGEFLTSVGVEASGANFSRADLYEADLDTDVDFSDANLSGAVLTGDTLGDTFVDANFTGANLTGASMGYSYDSYNLPANLTGANVTGTILVPPNQSVTATSQAGAVATWSTPAGLPGATPGSCTPASGSTFPLFTSTVTCQVLDFDGDVATGTFTVTVEPTTQYFTSVLVPASGATLAGRTYLDAAAGDGPGVTKVLFELSGGPTDLSDQVIATATPTLFGWLAQWDSASVANGSYTLQSVATDADSNTDISTAVSLTVDNPTPTTTVVLPAGGATLKGSQYLDATASSDVATVTYELSGGPSDLTDQPIATATSTYIGWAAAWNTASVPDGSYTLQSVASYADAVSGTSAPVSVTVDNPVPLADLAEPDITGTGTAAVEVNGCNIEYVAVDMNGYFPGPPIAPPADLQITGCIGEYTPAPFTGSFTLSTTNAGTLTGTVSGSESDNNPPSEVNFTLTLTVTGGTGAFAGTTGSLQVLLSSSASSPPTDIPFTGSVTVT